MSKFMNSRFAGLTEYVPGEQPQDQPYIKLNTNESPFPPSPGVIAAVDSAALEQLRLYPDPDCKQLIRQLSERYAVKENGIFVANGSDDILNFCFMAFCDQNRPAVFPDVTYGFYEVYAALHGVPFRKIPLKEDFSVGIQDYLAVGSTVVLANPNAQTGLFLPLEAIEQVVCSNPDHVVVVDEAYVDFGGESAVPLTLKYDNLLVVQTFSKSRCLAGARLGFAVGAPSLVADLNKLKYSTNPYNINRLTQLMGIAALRDDGYYRKRCEDIMKTRAFTRDALRERGFAVTDSYANFLLAKSDRMPGEALYRYLKAHGVLVRHFDEPRIADFNRITIGARTQMEVLLQQIDAALTERR